MTAVKRAITKHATTAVYTPAHIVTPDELAARLHIKPERVWTWITEPDRFVTPLPPLRMVGDIADVIGWPSGEIDQFINSLPDLKTAHQTFNERHREQRRAAAAAERKQHRAAAKASATTKEQS